MTPVQSVVPGAGSQGKPITFQLSLDLARIDEAVDLARLGVASGVQVLEAGTILILSEGARITLPRLKQEFPEHPIVADIKCTDGGSFDMGLVFSLGAAKATVMASASDATIKYCIREAAKYPGCEVMVDTMGFGGHDGSNIQGQVQAARRARDLGAHYIVLHLGFDERAENRSMVDNNVLLKWAEAVANENLGIPIQVVGGLTLAQAARLPEFGIGEIVISMNLGSSPIGEMQYDKITGFTVDLKDEEDRSKVSSQLKRFIGEVTGKYTGQF